jgi:hypothetical protein
VRSTHGELESLSLPSSLFDRLPLVFRHIGGIIFEPQFTNLTNAGGAVGAEDKSENFRNPIIEHAAVLGILKILAIGARCKLIAYAACPHLAPGSLLIFPASRAPAAKICPARPAIQPTAGDQFWIGDDFFHGKFLLNMFTPVKRPAG